MSWKTEKRKLGPAGGPRQRQEQQRRWDVQFGIDQWAIGYWAGDDFIMQEHAFESIYIASYDAFFEEHPETLQELMSTAKSLRNPHAEATGGVDLQVPALLALLQKRGLSLGGKDVVDIGSFGNRSHALSVRLSPSQIPCVVEPSRSLEKYWQTRKCLVSWIES